MLRLASNLFKLVSPPPKMEYNKSVGVFPADLFLCENEDPMEFTPRIRDILTVMLAENRPMSKQEIADKIGVSKRTCQREFEYLESDVKEYNLTVKNKKGEGTILEGNEEDLDRLRHDLMESKVVGAEGKDERCKQILFTLLKDRTPKKLYYYSNMLGVSEATAANDMESLRPWLKRYNLELIKRPGYGVTLDGDERDFRAAMRRFISENSLSSLFLDESTALSDAVMSSIHKKSIYSLLKQDTVDRVGRVLKDMNESAFKMLTDNAYMGLMIHIAIAVERIKSGGALQSDNDESLKKEETGEEALLAERILKRIEEEFAIEMPRTEIAFLMLHLRASKLAFSNEPEERLEGEGEISQEELISMIDQMVIAYDRDLAFELRSDEDFLEGLMMHLRPVLVRILNHMDIYNPLLSDIQADYPEVYQKSRRAAAIIEDETGCTVSDEEAGFLAMHFGAAEEKIRESRITNRRVDIGVVCASGFGLAKLMVARIRDHVRSNITLTSYGREEITPYVASKMDFFVSSFDLSDESVDFIRVSPLIQQSDIAKIQAKVNEYAHVRKLSVDADFSDQLEAANFATREIKGILDRYHHYNVAENMTFAELLRFLSMKATSNLSDAGKVMESIERREAIHSQVFPELGISLLHAETDGVEEATVISCTPRKKHEGDLTAPAFSDPYFKGTTAALLMLMPKDEYKRQHQEILGRVSTGLINDSHFLHSFMTGEEREVKKYLTKNLKQYFYEMLEKL